MRSAVRAATDVGDDDVKATQAGVASPQVASETGLDFMVFNGTQGAITSVLTSVETWHLCIAPHQVASNIVKNKATVAKELGKSRVV